MHGFPPRRCGRSWICLSSSTLIDSSGTSVCQQNRVRTAERIEIGNHDGLAGLQAGEDFDRAEAVRTGLDLAPLRDPVVIDYVGHPAATAVEKLAPLHHHDIAEFREQNAGGQALVLPQTGRAVTDKTDPAGDLVVDDFR